MLTFQLGLCAAGASAQGGLPRKIDCGDLNGFASGEPGYELLGEGQVPADVSLSPAPLDTVHVAGNFPNFFGAFPPASDVLAVDPDQLGQSHRFTALQLADGTVLAIQNLVPDTPYRLRLELGALFPWVDLLPDQINFLFHSTLSTGVRVQVQKPFDPAPVTWETYASNLRCTSPHQGASYDTIVSGVVPLWVRALSDSTGTLRVRLSTDGADPLFLTGFELHEHEALPVVYWRNAGGALNALTPGVAPFVAAFNQGDLDGAQTLALGIADDFERGVALTHLVGWLDGSRDERFGLIGLAQAALQAAGSAHLAAAWLLDELDSLQRALDHLEATWYDSELQCVAQGGTGFLNETCAGQIQTASPFTVNAANAHVAIRELRGITAAIDGDSVLDAMHDWNNGTLPAAAWEPSPLVFASAKLVGSSLISINPLLSGSDAAMQQDRDALFTDFVGLGFAATDFPADLEMLLFEAYVDIGAWPSLWPQCSDVPPGQPCLEDVLSDAQIDASWWGPQVALLADDPAAPAWANLQRSQARIQRNIVRYWVDQRLREGELGGGRGDDVELLAQLAKAFSGRQDQLDRRTLDGLAELIDFLAFESGDVVNGFFAGGMTDVEHSAEYTTDPYLAALNAFGHTAQTAQIALGSTEHLLYAQDPAIAFSGLTGLGRLHFKSWFFTANGPKPPPDDQLDILLNGRAMYPGVTSGLHAPLAELHPMLADLRQWADAWRDDALDTGGGKPLGWYGAVQWPSNEFGTGGFWWADNGSAWDISDLTGGLYSYTLDLLRMAYRTSTAAGDWVYLAPAAIMFRDVMTWEDAGKPSATPGSAWWAAKLFKSSGRFPMLVITYLADLQDYLDGHPAPNLLSVDQALIDRMRVWSEDQFLGQHAALKYSLRPILPCVPGNFSKSETEFTNTYEKILTYYRTVYPLLTKHVIRTDRVPLNYKGGGPVNLQVAINGEVLEEGLAFEPLARFRGPPGASQDIAVQCNFRDYAATAYSAFAYNFESSAVTTTLMLDTGLVPGEYQVEWGDAISTCDMFPGSSVVTSVQVQKRGTGASTDVTLVPGLNLVRVTRAGDALSSPARYDLMLDAPVVEIFKQPGVLDLRFRMRVANMGELASPAATLNLYAGVMLPDGSLFQLPGFPPEFFVAPLPIPSLAGTPGWTMDETSIVLDIPVTSLIATLFQSGLGLQLHAEIVADGLESDLLNNDQTRGWTLLDIDIVHS